MMAPNEKSIDVIVIGCGAAGIAALCQLHKKMNVLGLEAADQIGGRIKSVEVKGSIIDLGAEWCHGETGNKVFELAEEHLARPDEFNVIFMNSGGERVDSEVAKNFVPIYYQIHESTVEEMAKSDEPLGYHLNKAFWDFIQREHPDSDQKVNEQLHRWFQLFENSINASDNWNEASGKGHLEYHDCDGELLLHWKGKGYQTILDVLQLFCFPLDIVVINDRNMQNDYRGNMGSYSMLNTLKDPMQKKYLKDDSLNIKFGKEVVRIDWTCCDRNGVRVKCKDGTEYFSQHVVVTTSLGVLKERHQGMFLPSLPHKKVDCINGLKLGVVNKMFLVFDKPWWGEKQCWFGLLWEEEDMKTFESSWLLDVFAFNTCEHNPHVLCGWVVGSAARHMETLSNEMVQEGLYKLLCHFFRKTHTVQRPSQLIRSKWFSNEFTRGSYSFRSVDSEKMGVWASDLALPLYDDFGSPVVCFAGEASSSHYFSTVHGAIETGLREADRLIKYKHCKFRQSKL